MPKGSVRIRADGMFEARVDIGQDPITGKRRQASRSFPTEAQARDWVKQPVPPRVVGREGFVDPSGFYVYALYGDVRTTPLYVGQTANVFMRLGKHYTDSRKKPHIRRIGLLRCHSRDQALELEQELIEALRPPWNIAFKARTGDAPGP